jgi:hypothetical protein
MAQRFLIVKNFEKYNPGSTRSYPWIKLYRDMLLDVDFLQLDVTSRYLYVCLLILASDHANKIPMNVSYLSHRCAMDVSETMLKPLYRSGFLQASRSTIARLDKNKSREDQDVDIDESSATPPKPQLSRREKLEVFSLTDEDREWATDKLGITNPDDYVDEFKDYWRAEHDKKLKGDWQATFRNRLRWLKDNNKLKANVWA